MMDIADRILHLRKARGISQEELAEQVGVKRSRRTDKRRWSLRWQGRSSTRWDSLLP